MPGSGYWEFSSGCAGSRMRTKGGFIGEAYGVGFHDSVRIMTALHPGLSRDSLRRKCRLRYLRGL